MANQEKPLLKNNYIYYSFYIKFFSLMLSNTHLAAEHFFEAAVNNAIHKTKISSMVSRKLEDEGMWRESAMVSNEGQVN